MSSRSRRNPPVRSDVPTRSTGYEDEQARVAAWHREQLLRGPEEAEEVEEASVSDTPILDAAVEDHASTGDESLHDSDRATEDYWSDEAIAAREAARRDSPARDEEASPARDEEVSPARDHEVAPARDQDREIAPAPAERFDPNARVVSAKAMKRLAAAKVALAHTKKILSHGAGNQLEALRDTNFNSYFRMQAMRDPACWVLDPALASLARRYPDALIAAKAELAQGGNCGEHAMVAFDYLRMTLASDGVNRCDKAGLDHAFVIIGDVVNDKDEDLAVCDPWPTGPTACLWDDHFAFTADRSKLNTRNSVSGDDEDVKTALAAGLRLSAKGEAMIGQEMSSERTEEEIKKGREGDKPWIWQHSDTTSRGAPPSYRAGRPGA